MNGNQKIRLALALKILIAFKTHEKIKKQQDLKNLFLKIQAFTIKQKIIPPYIHRNIRNKMFRQYTNCP